MKRITIDSPISTLFPIVDWLTKHDLTPTDLSVLFDSPIIPNSRKKHFAKYFCIEFSDVDEILSALSFLMGGSYYEN